MYVGAAQEEAFAEKKGEFVTPTHFWCNRTQTVIGVDDRPAHKSACNPLRSCCEQ